MFAFFVGAYIVYLILYICAIFYDNFHSSHKNHSSGSVSGIDWTGDSYGADIKSIKSSMDYLERETHDDFGKWLRS